jgi:hypothetical protein
VDARDSAFGRPGHDDEGASIEATLATTPAETAA